MTLLDETLLTETLTALPGWEGNGTQIWRDVRLTPHVDAELRRQVAVDAAAMGHSVEVQDLGGGATRFVLHSEGGVTERDIALASHLSDLAHRIAASEPGIAAVREDEIEVVSHASEAS